MKNDNLDLLKLKALNFLKKWTSGISESTPSARSEKTPTSNSSGSTTTSGPYSTGTLSNESKLLEYNKFIPPETKFINLQGEGSIKQKLQRTLGTGDQVILLKDIPEDNLYRGYLCTISDVFYDYKNKDEDSFEIQFYSTFDDNDLSRISQKKNKDFVFPTTNAMTVISKKYLVRIETQDLEYRTYFP